MEDNVTSIAGSLVWELITSLGPIPRTNPSAYCYWTQYALDETGNEIRHL